MRIYKKYIFDYSMELVLKVTHYDLISDTKNYETLPNVASVKRTHFNEHPDGRQDIEFTYCAHGQIPKIAQKILTPKMLTWREVSKWDPRSRTYSFEIIPFFLANVFYCKGIWTYEEKDGKVVQIMDGNLNIKIPILGGIIEDAIVKELYRNQEDLNKTHHKNMKALSSEPPK